jgi:hypothetical protein
MPSAVHSVEGLFLLPDLGQAFSVAAAGSPGEESIGKKKSPSSGLKMAFTEKSV